MNADDPFARGAIAQARTLVRDLVRPTPLVSSPSLSERLGRPVLLKLETVHPSGAFKWRGACHAALRAQRRGEAIVGFVTGSTGNHGRSLAIAAARLGLRCTVHLSELVPEAKRAALRRIGAATIVGGADQGVAIARAKRQAEEQGLLYVSPFDDPDVILGQGTLGLELAEQVPDAGTVIVPLSGGGLLAGVGLGLREGGSRAEVIGLGTQACPAMAESVAAGRPVEVEERPSLADSLGGGIGMDNRWTLGLVRELASRIESLDEEAVAAGIRHAFREERLIVEGAAAIGLGWLLTEPALGPGPVVVLVTGNTIDLEVWRRIVDHPEADARSRV